MIRSISVPYCLIGSYKTLRQNLKKFNFFLLRRASRGAGRRPSGVGDGGRARTRGGEMEAIFRLFSVCLMQAIP